MRNPFLFGKTASEIFFADREFETNQLLTNIDSGINTIIVSPRRYGKTSLVYCLQNKNPGVRFAYVSIFNICAEAGAKLTCS